MIATAEPLQIARPGRRSFVVVPLMKWHLEILLPHLKIRNFPEEGMRLLSMPGCSFTVLGAEAQVLGCAGVMQLWPGVGEATAFFTPELRKKFPISLHKAVLVGLERIRRQFNFHRIQMHVAPDFEAGCKWAERLGFKYEGEMPGFTSDKRTLARFGKTWL